MIQVLKNAAIAVLALSFGAAGVASAATHLKGEGASFPAPLYQKWTEKYAEAKGVKVDYQVSGSGAGVKAIIAKTVDFAGSDAPLNKDELAAAKAAGGDPLQIPSCAGAVVAGYNVPGLKGDLKLTGPVLAEIYLGEIKTWNDPRIATLNAGESLPALPISPVYRSDSSGTNYVFTSYLSGQDRAFGSTIGSGKSVSWKSGTGADKNAGVAAVLGKVAGAIGYLELNYAIANKIPFAEMQNKAGKFVKASPESVSKAGENAVSTMKSSLAVSLWNQAGDEIYPISAFTYLIVYRNQADPAKAKVLVDFLTWVTHDGQKLAPDLTYAPLSDGVVKKIEEQLATVK